MIGIIEPEATVVEQGTQLSAAEIQAHFTEKRKLQMVSEARQQLAERKITLSELIKQAEDERDKEKWVLGEILGKDELVQLFEGVSDFQMLRNRINNGDQQALYTLQERVNTLSPEIQQLGNSGEDVPLNLSELTWVADVMSDEREIYDIDQYFQQVRSHCSALETAWAALKIPPFDFRQVTTHFTELQRNRRVIEQVADKLAQRISTRLAKKLFATFVPDISQYIEQLRKIEQVAHELYENAQPREIINPQKREELFQKLGEILAVQQPSPTHLVEKLAQIKRIRLQQSPEQARDFSTLARLADQMNVVIRANERIARAQTKLENNSDKAERAMPHVSSIQELDDQIVEQLVRHLRANPTQESEALDQFIQGLIDQQVNFVEGVQVLPGEAIKKTPETEDSTQKFQRLMGPEVSYQQLMKGLKELGDYVPEGSQNNCEDLLVELDLLWEKATKQPAPEQELDIPQSLQFSPLQEKIKALLKKLNQKE